MKQRIFNRGMGWYISASNYKDREDKAYMNVHFALCEEPHYEALPHSDFVFIDIDIHEQKYGSYHNKMTLTVFKYDLIESTGEKDRVEKQNKEYSEAIQDTAYTQKFGGSKDYSEVVSPDDLPFY